MTDEYISKIEEITGKDQRNRMLEIVRIMRRHDFCSQLHETTESGRSQICIGRARAKRFIKGGQILSTRPT